MPAPAFDPAHPFPTRLALAAGLSAGVLRGPGFRRLGKGVHVATSVPVTPLLLVRAALCTHPPDAFASHLSAAVVHGLPVRPSPWRHVSVLRHDDRRRRTDLVCHLAAPGPLVATVRGIRVSAPLQAFVELASLLPLVDLVVVGDHAVRHGWYSPEELVRHCRRSPLVHRAWAAAAAAYVRAWVDSPMETRVRMLLVLAGFPEPVVNLEIRNEHGDVLVRFDLAYPHARVAVEYDGRQHADSARQHDRDLLRREGTDARGWRLVVLTSDGIFRDPEQSLRRVAAVLRERGCTDVPRRFDDRWRTHFPGGGRPPLP